MYLDIVCTLILGGIIVGLLKKVPPPPPLDTPQLQIQTISTQPTDNSPNRIAIYEGPHLVHVTTKDSLEHLEFLSHPNRYTYKILGGKG